MTAAESAPDRRLYLAAWLAVAAVLCAPIWLVEIPPLSDYYNHLARLYILHHYGDVAQYQQFYAVEWGLMPNLALDVIGLPLIAVLGLAGAAKAFLTLTVLVWHLGCHYLGRAIYGRPTWRALVCGFFVYNQQFLHGYVNFIFSAGLCMLALAYWLENRRRWTVARLALITVVGAMVFLSHLSGFATLAIAIAAMTVLAFVRDLRAGQLRLGNLALGVIPLLPGTVLFFYGFLSKTGEGNPMLFAPIAYNVRDALSLLTGYHELVDMASLAAVVVLAGVALIAALVSRGDGLAPAADARGQRWTVAGGIGLRPMPFVAGAALGAVYWICPSDVASGIEVNVRFLLGACTLLAFSIDLRLSAALRGAILGAALALFALRVAVCAVYWLDLDEQFADHRASFAQIEEGAAVHNIYFYPVPRLWNAERVRGLALIHAPCFAAVDRHANVPTLYGLAGQQPLSHRQALYRAHRFPIGSAPQIRWDEIFATYDYLWTCRAPKPLLAPLEGNSQLLAEIGGCALYRLERAR